MSVGIRGVRQGLRWGPQGRGQFGEGPRYDVQVAVHGPQLHQDVPDAGFQAGGRGGPRAGLRGGSRGLPGALLPARCPGARDAAPLGPQGGRRPLALVPADSRRGGRGAAGQPVAKARGRVRGGDNDGVEACASGGAGAGRRGGRGGRWQQRGQHGGAWGEGLGLAGGGGRRQCGRRGAGLLGGQEQGGRRLGVQSTGL